MASKALNFCLAIIRWAPVIFITAVIVWSYYAYVIQMCLFTVNSIPEKVFYLLMYHPLLFMFLWSYARCTFANPTEPPKTFYLSRSEAERFETEENEEVQKEILSRHGRNLPVQCRTASGAFRYCEKCRCIKPDRAHHCSVCGRCILKMDHHCPWVNNCVCFSNYKFFVLFLGYALIYCLYVAATSLQYFIKFWTAGIGERPLGNLHILFLFFASVMFALSVSFLFFYHLYLVCKNRSTLESFRAPIFRSGPDKDGFSLGRQNNFIEIFGEEKRQWFLPVFTSCGDGVTYPTRTAPLNSYHSMDQSASMGTEPAPTTAAPPSDSTVVTVSGGSTQPSFGDGVNYPIRTVDEDYDGLLSQRQRWMEEGDADGSGSFPMETSDRTGLYQSQ